MAEPAPPNPPPHQRRFCQIHLITAIVLMFVAGALVLANMIEGHACLSFGIGWPVLFWSTPVGMELLGCVENHFAQPWSLSSSALLIDCFVTLFLLACCAFVCERLLPQRERSHDLFDSHRFSRIHLATAIVLMFLTGVLMWANRNSYTFVRGGNSTTFGLGLSECVYGWPINCWDSIGGPYGRWGAFFANLAVSLAILSMAGVSIEARFLRREHKDRLFQLHLLTAIVLMFLAGALLPVVIAVMQSAMRDLRDGGAHMDQMLQYAVILLACSFTWVLTGAAVERFLRRRERKP